MKLYSSALLPSPGKSNSSDIVLLRFDGPHPSHQGASASMARRGPTPQLTWAFFRSSSDHCSTPKDSMILTRSGRRWNTLPGTHGVLFRFLFHILPHREPCALSDGVGHPVQTHARRWSVIDGLLVYDPIQTSRGSFRCSRPYSTMYDPASRLGILPGSATFGSDYDCVVMQSHRVVIADLKSDRPEFPHPFRSVDRAVGLRPWIPPEVPNANLRRTLRRAEFRSKISTRLGTSSLRPPRRNSVSEAVQILLSGRTFPVLRMHEEEILSVWPGV